MPNKGLRKGREGEGEGEGKREGEGEGEGTKEKGKGKGKGKSKGKQKGRGVEWNGISLGLTLHYRGSKKQLLTILHLTMRLNPRIVVKLKPFSVGSFPPGLQSLP